MRKEGLHWMREVSSSRSMASPCVLCCEKGDLSPNSLQFIKNTKNPFSFCKRQKEWIQNLMILQQIDSAKKDRQRSERKEEERDGETGRRATREERSVPCRRRGETEQEHWLLGNSASPVFSVCLPFALLPFSPTHSSFFSLSLFVYFLNFEDSVCDFTSNNPDFLQLSALESAGLDQV